MEKLVRCPVEVLVELGSDLFERRHSPGAARSQAPEFLGCPSKYRPASRSPDVMRSTSPSGVVAEPTQAEAERIGQG